MTAQRDFHEPMAPNQTNPRETQTNMLNDQSQNTQNDDNAFAVEDQLSAMQKQIDDLKRQVSLARGTGDVTAKAVQAQQALAPQKPLIERIELALRNRPMTYTDLSKATGEPVTKVQAAMKTARVQKKVFNIGQEDYPRWTWRIGDKTTSEELRQTILRLISDQPLSFAQIVAATGASGAHVQGALIEIRRSGIDVHNFGTKARARYLVVPPTVLDAKLAPKMVKKS